MRPHSDTLEAELSSPAPAPRRLPLGVTVTSAAVSSASYVSCGLLCLHLPGVDPRVALLGPAVGLLLKLQRTCLLKKRRYHLTAQCWRRVHSRGGMFLHFQRSFNSRSSIWLFPKYKPSSLLAFFPLSILLFLMQS